MMGRTWQGERTIDTPPVPRIFVLNAEDFCRFEACTFPKYRSALGEAGAVAIGLEVEEAPAGLALARLTGKNRAEVLSLYVDPGVRGQGLGLSLLERLERELEKEGCMEATGVFMEGTAGAQALERLLASSGWEPPLPRMLVGQASFFGVHLPDWVYRQGNRLPDGAEIFLWRDLTALERDRMLDGDPGWFPDQLDPFFEEPLIEPLNSVGLRLRDGTIAGWMITHRIDPETIRYSRLFVREALQGSGAGGLLLAEAIRLQSGSDVPGVSFGVKLDNSAMLRLVRRWLMPILSGVRVTKGTRKELAIGN